MLHDSFNLNVFPARAGMSPIHTPISFASTGVPRASGDEPGRADALQQETECSPRERG